MRRPRRPSGVVVHALSHAIKAASSAVLPECGLRACYLTLFDEVSPQGEPPFFEQQRLLLIGDQKQSIRAGPCNTFSVKATGKRGSARLHGQVDASGLQVVADLAEESRDEP